MTEEESKPKPYGQEFNHIYAEVCHYDSGYRIKCKVATWGGDMTSIGPSTAGKFANWLRNAAKWIEETESRKP